MQESSKQEELAKVCPGAEKPFQQEDSPGNFPVETHDEVPAEVYGEEFQKMLLSTSCQSAEQIVPYIMELVRPESVVDVGCGVGAWLAAFRDLGKVKDHLGFDGDYIEEQNLLIAPACFIVKNLEEAQITCERTFDLAVSLEVAEHLSEQVALSFVESLTQLAPVVLFSAAIPNQGGTNHINEQWPSYWAELFSRFHYVPVDCIRAKFWNNEKVSWWYSQNAFLYVKSDQLEKYPQLCTEYHPCREVPTSLVHPLLWKYMNESIYQKSKNTMHPKVSIIIPVYNVERYLRECLDSVVNQTMRDIQIICVNDGSTDASPAILEAYAAKDPRIEVFHQENKGAGSARNATYPHIRGKYCYFVDSDDWIDHDLCQKAWDKAEATGADFVSISQYADPTRGRHSRFFDSSLPDIRRSPEEKHEIFDFPGTCQRFWRSDFFLSNKIKFTEGKGHPADDYLPTWKGTALAERVAVLHSPLYHYRARSGSLSNTVSEKQLLFVDVFNEIEKMLHEIGRYEIYKNSFIEIKWKDYYNIYHWIPHSLQRRFLLHMRKYVTDADREFFRNAHFDTHIRKFFLLLVDGGWFGYVEYQYSFQNIIKWPERTIRRNIIKPLKALAKWSERTIRRNIIKPLKVFFSNQAKTSKTASGTPLIPTISWTGSTLPPLELTSQQRESLARHPLQHWQSILLKATEYIDFRNKTILEIGGSNLPHDFVFGVLGAKKWICVDLIVDKTSGGSVTIPPEATYPLNHQDSKKIIRDKDFVLFTGSATEIGEELHGEFDACVSICAFEHIHELHKAVEGIYHSLQDRGVFFTQFGPIWSGPVGHHFWVDDQHNFNTSLKCHLPPFVHLLYSGPEMDELLAPYYTTGEEIQIKKQIVNQCATAKGTRSNGLFYEDFFNIMKDSRFQRVSVTPFWQEDVEQTTYQQLRRKYPDYHSFGVNGIQIVAQK